MKKLGLLLFLSFASNSFALECSTNGTICADSRTIEGAQTTLAGLETAQLFPGCSINGRNGFVGKIAQRNAESICSAYTLGKLVKFATAKQTVKGVVNMSNANGGYTMPGWVNMYDGILEDTGGERKVISSITCENP